MLDEIEEFLGLEPETKRTVRGATQKPPIAEPPQARAEAQGYVPPPGRLNIPVELAVLVAERSQDDLESLQDWIAKAFAAKLGRDAMVNTLVGSGWPAPFVIWYVDGPPPASPGNTKSLSHAANMEMVEISAGDFMMGTANKSKEHPARHVYLDAYMIGKNLVTVFQFRKYCETARFKFDWNARKPDWGWIDDHPMVNVTWQEAQDFCQWAGGDLPTEAQWEKAARGTDGRIYPWGSQWNGECCRHSNGTSGDAKSTSTVGSYPAGASPYGCLDMAGNVWQWCSDWYQEGYDGLPERNPTGPKNGKWRMLRGGSWHNSIPDFFRSAYRLGSDPKNRYNYHGFRLATKL